ncbi:DUF6896 domain-containing protein, partial [Actinocorallia sp. A-T 12471]|uniref:DUF6896 domain-containing protein n=1 Tax=Actinocorallia sp. A-T 12471 TaxID=3089813 RepID=UPI0029D204DB
MLTDDQLISALAVFRAVRAEVEGHFGVAGAASLVQKVMRGEVQRMGRLPSGSQYSIHGVGYTVQLIGEVDVHLDAGPIDGMDVFTLYDLQNYFDDTNTIPTPGIDEIRGGGGGG